MNEKVLRITEFHRITERLSEYASSAPGKKLCLALTPMHILYDIEQAQSETETATAYLLRKGSVSFGSNRDFNDTFKALAVGAQVSAPQLLQLASFLENAGRAREYGVLRRMPRRTTRSPITSSACIP